MALIRIKSKLFQRMVLSYFAILSIPIVIFSWLFYNQVQEESRLRQQEAYAQSISNIIGVMERKFFDITSLGERLLTVNWLQRARSDSDIISRYFDTTRKNDVCQELRVHAASIGVADSLAVLLLQKDEAVSTGSWGSMEEILSTMGFRDQEGQEELLKLAKNSGWFQVVNAGEAGIIPGSQDLLVLQSLDVLNDSRGVLLIRIGKRSLDNYLQKLQFGDLTELSLVNADGQTIYCYKPGTIVQNDYTSVEKSELFSWNYQVILKASSPTGLFEQFSTALTALLMSLLMGVLAAILLATLSYRPIRNLVSHIGGDRKGSEFQTISDAFDRLTAEREALNSMIEQYRNSARNNLLFNLLHGCFAEEQIQAQMDGYQIGYRDDQYFLVLLFRCQNVNREQRFPLFLNIKAGLLAEQLSFDLLETLDEDIVAILCFQEPQGDEVAGPLAEKLSAHVRKKMGAALKVSWGGEEKGLIGISKSYQAAKERILRLRFPDAGKGHSALSPARCYYPTDWELQLINNLKLGNAAPALKILQELRQENDRRQLSPAQQMKVVSMIFDTILRLMDELEMDSSEPADVFEESFGQTGREKQWEYLENLVQKICSRASYSNQEQGGGPGEQILRYVDANFENPDLSLQVLGDQLGLSVSAISRLFKATMKINFYDYLCRIRMEKAKEYLRETEIPVAEVARKVGYENELSFKRAFVRYEGIKPRDYRQNQQDAAKPGQ